MIKFALKGRKITILFFIMAIMVGLLSFLQLPRQESPDVVVNVALVTTIFPGASPERIEQTVTRKLEQKIKELQGIKTITSTSGSGYSSIVIDLKDGVKPKEKWDELRKKVKDAEADLPKDAKQPVVYDDLAKTVFYTINITAPDRERLYSLRDTLNNWKDQLRTLPNVGEITLTGLPAQEVRVEFDPRKLQHYGISWPQIMLAVQAENERVPIGDLKAGGRIYQLRLPDTYKVEDLNQVVVSRTPTGVPVYLRDVGRAFLTTKDTNAYIYSNGQPAIVLGIGVEKGSDVPSTQVAVNAMLKEQQKSLPPWARVEPVYSQSEKVNDMFGDLIREMIIAVAAVLLVCALGLNFSTAVMVALAIPISMSVGLICLPYFNITINNISIYALIIVLGVLVDDAVVVNDNIERRLYVLNETPYEASLNGANEVSVSILTATLAAVFAFGPLAFLRGVSGEFIKPIPIVITLTMLTSMIMSLTIIPIFRNWYEHRKGSTHGDGDIEFPGLLGKPLHRLTDWYSDNLMPRILKRPLKVGVIAVLIASSAYLLVPFTPVELFPAAGREELPIFITLPQGSDIDETHRVVNEIRDWLAKQPGVKDVYASAGGQIQGWFGGGMGLDNTSPNSGSVTVRLDLDKVNGTEVTDKWREYFTDKYPGVSIYPFELQTGPPVGKPITVHFYGQDITQLRALTQTAKDHISKIPGAYKVEDNFGLDLCTLEFQVNKDMMKQRMVSYSDLSRTLRLVSEGIQIGQYDNGKDLVDMILYSEKSGIDKLAVFQNLSVPNARGQQVPLSEIATIKPAYTAQAIPHRNMSRAVTITGDVRGRTATEVMNDVTTYLENLKLPAGYRWEVGGEMTEQTDIFVDMGRLSIIVFFLILIQIAIQFYSLSLPLLVMSTIYLAGSGSLIGLFVTRTPLGFMTMMGIISLSGIVVRNGIVFIDFIEKARKSGTELTEAVISAGRARLRPILLTSMTAIAGLLPLTFGGDPLFEPLAMTIISGLAFSTILTLVVVPSWYVVIARYKERRDEKKLARRALNAGING
ncbi:MAG: efflux RND transporter permease subunit [Acidobacteriota bacterium]